MKRAAIAIGSNSTRLLVAEKQAGKLTEAERGREETRLFLGLDEAGNIRPERLEETARAVARLAERARAKGAESIALFATSAARDARNSALLGERIRALSGLSLRIIPGEEEARLAFLAAAGDCRRLVIDIGGGSTEMTLGENGAVQWSASVQMGASRLLRSCPIAHQKDAQRALDLARQAISPYAAQLKTLPPAPAMIGLGGSCTTSAAMTMGKEAHGAEVEGRIVTRVQAAEQLRLLAGLPLEARRLVPGLPPGRAEHMPHGLCILLAVLDLCGFDQLTVSGRTNLDGYLLSLPE